MATVGDCFLHFTQRNTSSNEAPEDEVSDGVRTTPPHLQVSHLPKAYQPAAEALTMSPLGDIFKLKLYQEP